MPAFPYLSARRITVGNVPLLALRVTYVGELGWELYPPSEYGATLWDTLWAAGAEHGLTACGYRAIDALRLEKGYRVWSSDITPEETPYEAGLGFAVRLDDPQGGAREFIGRAALVTAKAAGPRKRLRCLVLDDPRSVCLGNEPVRIAGAIVGRVTSGGYGFAVERSIAYAYLPPDQAAIGTRGEIEVFGEWIGFRGGDRAALRPGRRADPGMTTSPEASEARFAPSIADAVAGGPAWSATRARVPRLSSMPGSDFAQAACDAADALALRHFRRDLEIMTKPDRSFVTVADQAIERLIRERILAAYPDHGLVGEEYGSEAGAARCRWYIDPIDGTHNFIRGVPLFGTLLALEVDGELQLGVISAPALRERWYARRGGGAWALGAAGN